MTNNKNYNWKGLGSPFVLSGMFVIKQVCRDSAGIHAVSSYRNSEMYWLEWKIDDFTVSKKYIQCKTSFITQHLEYYGSKPLT